MTHEQTDSDTLLRRFSTYATGTISLRDWLREIVGTPDMAALVKTAPTMHAQLVRKLEASHSDVDLTARAADPNTPPDELIGLAELFPEAFCANPILPLLLLERPSFLGELPAEAQRTLLRYEGLPPVLAEWLAAYAAPELASEARMHVALAGEAGDDWEEQSEQALHQVPAVDYNDLLLELTHLDAVPAWMTHPLAQHADRGIRRATARTAPRETLRTLRRAGAAGMLDGFAPPDPSLSSGALEQLCQGGLYARRCVARNPHTPPAALLRLCADSDVSVRQGLAGNPALPPQRHAELARDRAPEVRQALARRSDLTPRLLRALAGDAHRDVRWTIARNPAAPGELLERLAADPDRVVRQGVARNPAVSPALLERLAADPHPRVRGAAARHPAAPPALRALLDGIAPAARRSRPKTPPAPAAPAPTDPAELQRLADDDDPRRRAAAAGSPCAPPELLAALADDDIPSVRCAVVANPSTPPALLVQMISDFSWTNARVRAAAAGRPDLPSELLAKLSHDMSIAVRRVVIAHPNTPPEARDNLIQQALANCFQSSEPYHHMIALAHPQTFFELLAHHVAVPIWYERLAIARNPQVPDAALELLLRDGHRLVRAAARAMRARRIEQQVSA